MRKRGDRAEATEMRAREDPREVETGACGGGGT